MRFLEDVFEDVAKCIQRGELDSLEWLAVRVEALALSFAAYGDKSLPIAEDVSSVTWYQSERRLGSSACRLCDASFHL